jgi:hypothetical protein
MREQPDRRLRQVPKIWRQRRSFEYPGRSAVHAEWVGSSEQPVANSGGARRAQARIQKKNVSNEIMVLRASGRRFFEHRSLLC